MCSPSKFFQKVSLGYSISPTTLSLQSLGFIVQKHEAKDEETSHLQYQNKAFRCLLIKEMEHTNI